MWDNVLNIFKRKKKGENIIKRDVNILSVKDKKRTDFIYKFAFSFFKENNKKSATVSVDDEKVILGEGQSCIFTMKSGNSDLIRLKATPDFRKEGCYMAVCQDPNIKDEDM
jgi:hypothetical protein